MVCSIIHELSKNGKPADGAEFKAALQEEIESGFHWRDGVFIGSQNN
jgi:hypothetical protein